MGFQFIREAIMRSSLEGLESGDETDICFLILNGLLVHSYFCFKNILYPLSKVIFFDCALQPVETTTGGMCQESRSYDNNMSRMPRSAFCPSGQSID